jgi:hypothetical protein
MRLIMGLAQAVSTAALLGSLSLAAQVPTEQYDRSAGVARMEVNPDRSKAPDVSVWMPPAASCPVSLRAQHGADGAMRNVDKSRPGGLAQRLLLTVTAPRQKRIVEARLRVRGMSGKGRTVPMVATSDGADTTRYVTVKFSQNAANETTADAWIPGVSAVLQVELASVTFDSGDVLRFRATDGCRFTPEHLMLVGSNGR